MATVNTNDLRVRNAKNLIESFFGFNNEYVTSPIYDDLLGADSDGSIIGPDRYGTDAVLGTDPTIAHNCQTLDNLLGVNSDGSVLGPNDYGDNAILGANGVTSDIGCGTPEDPVTVSKNSSYVFIGRPMPWEFDMTRPVQPGVVSGEEVPPVPDNSYREYYETSDQMLSLKRIDPNKCYHMIPRLKWESGLVYDMYRHDYTLYNRSYTNASNLYDAKFIVINQNNDVYACLSNNDNAQSTVEPTFLNGSSNPQYTSDGYQWLFLYGLNERVLRNYATQNYMPIYNDDGSSLESNPLPEGSIYTVSIVSRGLGYTNSPGAVPNEVPFYFCNIVGDGTGAVCRLTILDGRVFDVRVVRPGSGYTYATVDFTPGRVYRTLSDLDARQDGLNPRGDGTFRSDVIISPPGGWGYDFASQLGGTRVGVFSSLNYNQLDFLPDTTFRQIGIIQNIDTDSEEDTLSAHYRVKVIEDLASEEYGPSTRDIDFIVGETIYQTTTLVRPDGTPHTFTAKGTVAGWNKVDNIISYIQDPKHHTDDDGVLYRFSLDAKITTKRELTFPNERDKVVTPDVSFNGSYISQDFVNGYAEPEFIKYTGEMIYLTNLSPIKRHSTQTERVSLIISY